MVINHSDRLGEKRGNGELTMGKSSGGGIVGSGERSRVKACNPGSMTKNIGDMVSRPRERGMPALGQCQVRDRIGSKV